MINVRDELLRVDGVSDVNIFGERDYSIRVWLDPQKMAAYGINAGDVAAAIRSQNLDVPAGRIGQPPAPPASLSKFPSTPWAGSATPEQFGDIIVKVGQGTAVPMSAAAAAAPAQSPALPVPGVANPLQGGQQRRSATAQTCRTALAGSQPAPSAADATTTGTRSGTDRRRRTSAVPAPAAAASGGGAIPAAAATTGGGANAAAAPTAARTPAESAQRRQQFDNATGSTTPAAAPPARSPACRSTAKRRRIVRRHVATACVRPPYRRPASSASATWPAWKWAPRTTTRRRPSTAINRWASPSFNSPAPTPWTLPTA